MIRALLPIAFVIAALPGATGAEVARPPDGTYTYKLLQLGSDFGTSTVTIASATGSITVKEKITAPPTSAVASTEYDRLTLAEKTYSADFNLPQGAQHTTASVKPNAVTVQVPGQTAEIKADSSAPLMIIADNLVGTNVLIPAILHASNVKAYTLAVLAGGRAIRTSVVEHVNLARPASVPAGDVSLVVDAGGLREIFWFDPASYRLDDLTVPTQNFEVRLVSQSPTIESIGTPAPAVTPMPTSPPHFDSADVDFESADGTRLAGTLTIPQSENGRFPAIVLVHGSGAQDRNETVGPNLIFLQLSNALSNAGYVVLRYDKRGVGKSGGSAATGTRDMLLADARAAYRFLAAQPQVDPKRTYALGHSEGGELVPSLASTEPSVAGIVLMAPPALPLRDVIMQQVLESVPSQQRRATEVAERRALADIRTGKSKGPEYAWVRTSLDIDPIIDIKRVRAPVLILQGAKDVQVLAKDVPRLAKAARASNGDVTVRVFSDDNHLFMPVTPGEPLTPAAAVHQYLTVAGSIDPRVLETLIAWLDRHSH